MPAGSGDRWPDDYERGRPSYPAEVVELPVLAAHSDVLDLGAGTGKLTRLLVPRFSRVVAVEPAGAMRSRLGANCPEAEVLAGSAEEIPLVDDSVDAVSPPRPSTGLTASGPWPRSPASCVHAVRSS